MSKFKDYLLQRKEQEAQLKIEEAEMERDRNHKPTGIAATVLGWADQLEKVINDNSYATNKWGPYLNEWDEEPQK